MATTQQRHAVWTKGNVCEVYSRGEQRWISAKVLDEFSDDDGRWIKVQYERTIKDVRPDHSGLRPTQNGNENDSNELEHSECVSLFLLDRKVKT